MKYAFVALAAVLVLAGAGCFSRDDASTPTPNGSSTYDTDGANSDEAKELQALLLVNVNLILEAGRVGIDVPRTRDWSERTGRISLQTSTGNWEGAIEDMKALNAEIQAAIDVANN